jgi:hypothetical protein
LQVRSTFRIAAATQLIMCGESPELVLQRHTLKVRHQAGCAFVPSVCPLEARRGSLPEDSSQR